jgi:hypothetical protein
MRFSEDGKDSQMSIYLIPPRSSMNNDCVPPPKPHSTNKTQSTVFYISVSIK